MTVNDIASSLDNSQQIDAILLDFSKAFDKVPHRRLALKLRHYGVRGQTLHWITNFLHNRSQQVTLEGKSSRSAPVTSGVPQGTVLGPLLFLVYINDLPQRVKSTPRLFADDSLLYRIINTPADSKILQEDLDSLQEWERAWLMEFNPDKCEVLRISNKRKNIPAEYTIHDRKLAHTKQSKYLGAILTNNLSWNAHIDMVSKKANNTTAFLCRNLSSCPRSTKEACYKTFVRPQVEYAATVWDPHTQANTRKIEAVQRRAARFVSGDYFYKSSVTAMISVLGWESLEQRRKNAKTTMFYKIVNNLVAIPSEPYLHPQGVSTRGHSIRYLPPYCRTVAMKSSFFPSTICLWNQLPERLATAPTLNTFKARLLH